MSHNDSQDFREPQDPKDLQRNAWSDLASENHEPDFSELLLLPAAKFVESAIQYTAGLADTELEHDEDWNSPMFAFARLCKAHPALTNLSDVDAMRTVENIMLTLGDSLGDPWATHFPVAGDPDDVRADFMSSWISVKWIPFHDALSNATRLAQKQPLQSSQDRGDLYRRFISLAGALQFLVGDEKSICLPTRRLAAILKCDQRTVSRLRKFAIADGLLTMTKAHSFHSSGKSKATEFKFASERFPGKRNSR
jgi:hypothetical protein